MGLKTLETSPGILSAWSEALDGAEALHPGNIHGAAEVVVLYRFIQLVCPDALSERGWDERSVKEESEGGRRGCEGS